MYSSSHSQQGGYDSSNSNQKGGDYDSSNSNQQSSFSSYQPAPVYGSSIGSQSVSHSQQGMFGGYNAHTLTQPAHHHSENEPTCCRIL